MEVVTGDLPSQFQGPQRPPREPEQMYSGPGGQALTPGRCGLQSQPWSCLAVTLDKSFPFSVVKLGHYPLQNQEEGLEDQRWRLVGIQEAYTLFFSIIPRWLAPYPLPAAHTC